MERTSRSEYPRYKLNPTGTHATAKFPGEKMNERELLHGLNDRFAGFIEKVHHLEHQNHFLQREIEEIRGNQETSTAALEQEYAPELRDLRRLVRGLTQQKHQVEIERQNLENEASELKQKFDRESQSRAVAESDIMMMKRDMGDAHQAKLQLHLKAQALQDEIDFLKTNHEAEVSEIISQIQHSTQDHGASTMEFGKPELTVALREIRSQLEGSTLSDLRRAEETFLFQFAKLTEIAERKREALKESHREIQEYRRSLQARSTELDCVKGAREALEKQLREVEDHHHGDVIHYQDTIKKLENELIDAKFYMSGHLREYQDLLNVKMALDVEILSYRKLLEGEENHLSSISDTHLSLPHIYRQSPVYSLPRPGQRGALSRRAEPQYKFVEEIITETTREIETSEFEETETPLQETARAEGEESRDKGEGGKGKEGGEGCQDGREEDGEQDQVEPEGDGERGDQDRSLLGENAEDGGRGEVRGESEQAEADNTDKDNTETGRVSCGEREETNDAARAAGAEREASLTPEKSEEVAAEGDDNGDAPTKSHRVGSKETNGGAQAKRPFQESSISGSQGSDRGGTESDDVAEAKGISLGSDTAAEKAELKTDLTREAADPAESKQSPLKPKRTEEDASSTETTPISQPSETVQVNMEKEPNGSKNISNDGSEKHHEELDDASNLTEFPQVEDKKQMVKSPAAVASTGNKATAGSTHQQIDPSSKEPKNPTDAESKDCGEVSGSQSQADVGTTKSAVGKVEDNSTSNLKGKLEGDLLNGGRGVKEQKEKPTKGEAQAEEKGGNGKEEKSSV